MESNKQKRANLLNDNPIAARAGGSWISKHSIAAGSPLHQGGSYKGSPMNQRAGDTAISDSNNDGNAVSRSLVAARNALDPSTKRALGNQNSSNQMFDYDSDGDTAFNDSNNDGNMVSRGLIAARNYLDPSAKQASGNKNSKNQMFDF